MADWIKESELCEWLKINRITAWRWRKEGMPHIGTRKATRYNKEQVETWLKEKARQNK